MIPLWVWPAIAVAALLLLAEWDCYCINRQRDHMRDIEAERRAREAGYPLGNVHRVYDRERDAA